MHHHQVARAEGAVEPVGIAPAFAEASAGKKMGGKLLQPVEGGDGVQ
jgi:hypothetical protein